jgi:hypothetical protein
VPAYPPFDPAVLAFFVIPVLLVLLFARACAQVSSPRQRLRIARLALLGSAAWMMVTWQVSSTGILRKWDATPPPLFILMFAILLLSASIAFSPLGRRLAFGIPLWILVGVQAFRLPLELAMHRLVTLGIMPEQMSYTGRNFDIVTGAAAIVIAGLLRTGFGGRALALFWNIAGSALLANVLVIAILSTPRFRYFGADRENVFVTYPPFVWLPAVMVLAALAGHLLIFRNLRARAT